jgi:general secretion pathway protein I
MAGRSDSGFTLIEVMIALAIVATALVALLGLQHQSLQSVIRGNDLTHAALLAQKIMSDSELERFPPIGDRVGDFQSFYPNQYPDFRWRRSVEGTSAFPDVRKVTVQILFGPGFHRKFEVVEFLHSPFPQNQ